MEKCETCYMDENKCVCSWKKKPMGHIVLMDDFLDKTGTYRIIVPPYLVELEQKNGD